MQIALYAHPFDLAALADQGGMLRLRELGVAELALAMSYHDGRWLMPWHGSAVRFLEDGTVHFRPRGDYGSLQPQPSACVPARGPCPLAQTLQQAEAVGLAVRAWTVFTHNTRLGLLHPDCCVQNLLGDRYPYALCPAQPAVAQYLTAMVQDLGAHAGLGAIEFEAFGWMGYKHSSHHDKSSFSPKAAMEQILSLCLCPACALGMAQVGGDPNRLRQWAKEQFAREVTQGDAMVLGFAAEDATAQALLAPLRAWRQQLLAQRFAAATLALPKSVLRAVQVHPDAQFCGSQLPLPQAIGCAPGELVLTAYGESVSAIRGMLERLQHQRSAGTTLRVSVWPKAPQFSSDSDLQALRELLAAHAVDSLAIYHLGLLPWRTLTRLTRALLA